MRDFGRPLSDPCWDDPEPASVATLTWLGGGLRTVIWGRFDEHFGATTWTRFSRGAEATRGVIHEALR